MAITNIQRNYNDDYELIVSANMDGIQFNNITHEDDGVAIDAPIIRKNNNWKFDRPYRPVVNAVDIDWNNAYVESLDTYINTTGDLLQQLNVIYNLLSDIEQPDLSNYLTHDDLNTSSLKEILDEVYADKSIETAISNIPTSIYHLNDYDDFAEKTWVNNLLRTYQKSAYDVYVENGGTLSKTEWLASLKGTDGINGKSAFEIAKQYDASLLNKTESEWVQSLKGEKGDKGDKGDTGPGINILGYYPSLSDLYNATNDTINGIGDAYNINGVIYVYNNLYDPSNDPISEKWKSAGQFKGDKGDEGKSAYDIYVEVQDALGNTPLTKEDWLTSIGGIEYSAGNHISISSDHVISVINRQSNEVWVNID